MKIRNETKNVIIILGIFIYSTLCVYSQNAADFNNLLPGMWNSNYFIPTSSDYMYNNVVEYICSTKTNNYLLEIDKNNNVRLYCSDTMKFKNNTSLNSKYMYMYVHEGKKRKDNNFWIRQYIGFIDFNARTDSTPLEVLNHYSKYDIKNVDGSKPPDSGSTIGIEPRYQAFCFDKTKDYVYIMYMGLCKMRTDKLDSVECRYRPPDNAHPGPNIFQSYPLALDENDRIWYGAGYSPNKIAYLDTKTEQYTVFNKADLPIQDTFRFAFTTVLYQSEKYNYAKYVIGSNWLVNTDYYEPLLEMRIPVLTNLVLKYENNQWDSIPLPYDMLIRNINGANVQTFSFEEMFQWSDNELAFSTNDRLMQPYSSKPNEEYRKYEEKGVIFIYNLDTKQWRKFVIPPQFIGNVSPDIVRWNNKHYFSSWTFSQNNGIVCYNPTNGIIDKTEMFISLWIENIYPNPAKQTLNIDILYSPSGSNNNLEIGLYNIIGQKVIDITNMGIYSEQNHTYTAKVSIPQNLPQGTYYLNVRNGGETRTKAIAIGE